MITEQRARWKYCWNWDCFGEYYTYIEGENTYQKIGTLPSSAQITVGTKDDLMTAFDKSYDLYCLGSRGNGKTMTSFMTKRLNIAKTDSGLRRSDDEIWRKYHPLGDCTGGYSMSFSATLPDDITTKEIQEAYRKALMN
jgi:hypothetical protein